MLVYMWEIKRARAVIKWNFNELFGSGKKLTTRLGMLVGRRKPLLRLRVSGGTKRGRVGSLYEARMLYYCLTGSILRTVPIEYR